MKPFAFTRPADFVPRIAEMFSKRGEEAYSLPKFGRDCAAGISASVVALPLALAFGNASGGVPVRGLYTAAAAGFCVSLFGGSRYQISGTTGAFAAVIFSIVAQRSAEELFVATILAGVILVAMGLTSLGRSVKFIPYPALVGFTAGIGIRLCFQQAQDFCGLQAEVVPLEFLREGTSFLSRITSPGPAAFCVGIGTVATVVALRRFCPRVPGAFVGVLAATALCKALALPVATVGGGFSQVPTDGLLAVLQKTTWLTVRNAFPDACTIALFAALESLLSAAAVDGMTGDRHNSDSELVAQGIGNVASAFFGGYPASGAVVRTAASVRAGAVSPVAGIISALALALFAHFVRPASSAIPLASLAAVLAVAAWDAANIPLFVRVARRAPINDLSVLAATCVLTVVVDPVIAVRIGKVLATVVVLRQMIASAGVTAQNDALITELAFGNIDPNTEGKIIALHRNDIEVYEITGPLFFGVADMLQDTFRGVERRPHALILRMRDVLVVDSTGIAALESFFAQCRVWQIRVILCEIRGQPRKLLEKAGFLADVGKENVAGDLDEAIQRAESG
jgi:SulP family sulfate permease